MDTRAVQADDGQAAWEARGSSLIDAFFARGVTVDLHLPDGWYGGRPMENQHELTLVMDRPARMIVELDERILLTFTGESMLIDEVSTTLLDAHGTPAIRISQFAQLVVDARLYGSSEARATVYADGEAHFISAR